MIDLVGWALGGLAVFFIGLLRHLPPRPGDRTAEALLAIGCGVDLLGVLLIGFDLASAPDDKLAAMARGVALGLGFAAGYCVFRLFRPPTPGPALPRALPPELKAAGRRIDEIFRAMRAEAARSAPILPADRRFQAMTKAIEEIDAIAAQSERHSRNRLPGRLK